VLQSSTSFVQAANSNAFVISQANADGKNPYAQLAYSVLTRCITLGFSPVKHLKSRQAGHTSKKGPTGPFGRKATLDRVTQP
jgi:hypothetical protein